MKRTQKTCTNNGVVGTYWRIGLSKNMHDVPIRIERKKPKTTAPKKEMLAFGFTVEPLGVGDYYGFELDGDGLYLLENHTVIHNTGKSTAFAWGGAWFLATRMNRLGRLVKVPILAPTFHQLYDVIWPEFKRWIPLSRLGPLLDSNNYEVWVKGMKDSVWARARSPKIPGHIQGNHATHLFWIIDESFGITDELTWETIEGSLTEEDNRIVMGGQHTTIVGYTHDAFNKDRDQWNTFRFDSEGCPLVKQEYCARIAKRYGKLSDIYRVRVKGMAPRGNPDAFIQLERVDAANAREVKGVGLLYMGVDPARFGDDSTVITIRHGNHTFPQVVLPKSDTDDIVNATLRTLRVTRAATRVGGKCTIAIDATGGYGAGTIDALNKNTRDNIEVISVNFGGDGDDEYADAASIMWGEGSGMLDEMELPNDDALTEELATRRFGHDKKGRIQIEPKKKYKKDFKTSPDHADSWLLSCTRRAPPKRVWKYYLSTSADHHRNFKVEWSKLETGKFQVFVTMVYEKNTGLYCGFYFWGRQTRRLYIYGDHCDINPVAPALAREVKRKAVVPLMGSSPIKVDRVYGNQEMFGKGDTLQKLLRRQKVPVVRNPKYESAGAIALVNQLFSRGQIVVHTSCTETDRQLRTWAVKKNRPEAGFPLCLGLCVVVSVLNDRQELRTALPLKPYGKERQQIRKYLRGEGKGDFKQRRREYDYLTK